MNEEVLKSFLTAEGLHKINYHNRVPDSPSPFLYMARTMS